MESRVTIRQIAEMAGVNASTVSRIFNPNCGHSISASVREKVLAIAAKYEYEPRSSARSLANGKSFQLGIILCKLESDLSSPNLSLFTSAFCREAISNGYQALLLPIEGGEFDGEVVKNIRSSKADAYYIGSNLMGMQTLEELTKRNIPVATYKSDSPIPDGLDKVTFVHTDDSTGYHEMFKTIKERGFGELAILCPESERNHPRMQLGNYCRQYNIELTEQLTFTAAIANITGWRDGFEAGEQLLKRIRQHKLIFCFSDMIALGLCKFLRLNGLEPGKDISVIAYDNIEENPNYRSLAEPFMATIDKNDRLAGKKMVESLLQQIDAKAINKGAQQVVNIPTKFIPRQSLGQMR